MRQRWILAVVTGLFLSASAVPVLAQTTTVNAGDIQGMAGATIAVPVSMTVPDGMQVATMQFNLTVAPNGSAPALTDQVTFTSKVGAPSLDLDNGPATRLVGWFNNFSPALTGTVDVGTLNVTIPAGAQEGDTYAVQVLNPSGTTDGETDLPMSGANGEISVVVPPTPTATPTNTLAPTPTNTLPATLTPTKTNTPVPTNTPTVTPTSSAKDDDGCQIVSTHQGSTGWLLLFPAVGLLWLRRRSR